MILISDNEIILPEGVKTNIKIIIIAMQRQKYSLDLYVDFLIASQKQYFGLELSKASPIEMEHDSVNRWLGKEKLAPKIVWQPRHR